MFNLFNLPKYDFVIVNIYAHIIFKQRKKDYICQKQSKVNLMKNLQKCTLDSDFDMF